ncbi:hypothetical protein [Cyanobium sp. CH-040]|uniref:hypothetical protein n=1 Tax=Cyanobium sp. CH-040 TaxID=2823708 RepID=UPI0020CF03E7|nr:hypothetical protein [Cyanobium sp. CH-040]MCP9928746.1 hypothetical protein [Cyanobium sp. CH-040]
MRPPAQLLRRLPPLRVTALATALLLAAPALLLLSMPRPRAEGLGRLLPHAGLLQSFPGAPEREPPPLWRQRLEGDTARLLWRQQRQIWWQFWSDDRAGGPYLVMPLPRPIRVGALPDPPHSLRVDGLLVVASGPLARQSLQEQLVQASRRQEGLQQRCLEMLEREPAAYWSPQGLEAMAGPLAPLLSPLQEGCLALELVPGELLLRGEAGSPRAASLPDGPELPASELPAPLGEGLLLRLSGRSLDLLLLGLLERQEVREAVASVYGLGTAELALVKDSPFELRLRPQPIGPFQAGLELVLPAKGDSAAWTAILAGLSERLSARGLQPDAPQESGGPPAGPKAGPKAAPQSATWRDDQGRVVGGWRWLAEAGTPPRLLLFLGPEPTVTDTPAVAPGGSQQQPLLLLQARPQALAALNLLPGQLPLSLLQARQLRLLADPAAAPADAQPAPGRGGGINRLQGRLQLGEPQPIRPQEDQPPPAE